MKNENSTFNGFSEPEMFFKLNHSWFGLWSRDLKEYGSNRRSLFVITEYLLKTDWIIEKTGKQGCSSLEIKRGFMHPAARRRLDRGTQLDARVIKKGLQVLVEKNMVVEVEYQQKSYFRINRSFFPELFVNKDSSNSSEIYKNSNFFKVPNYAFEIYKQTDSLAVILILEYCFRHSWGYKNEEGVWLTAEEFQLGREYSTGERYDVGVGFDKSTIYDALNECCSKGWMVVKRKSETGYSSDLYNLRFEVGNKVLRSVQSVTNDIKQETSVLNMNIQEFSVEKDIVRETESYRESSPIDCDNRDMNWVLLDDYSCVDADNSWAIAYSSWLNADPFSDNAISVTDLNCDFRWEDVNISCESALSDRVNAHGFCGDAEELQVKETLNTQPQSNNIETTTSNNSDILDQKLAVAVVNGNQEKFLLSLKISGSKLREILKLKNPDDFIFGWGLFHSVETKCQDKSPEGFIVDRLSAKDSPTLDYLAIGNLLVRDWLELLNIFKYHYSNPSPYIPEDLEYEADFFRTKLFVEREPKLPLLLKQFTKEIQILQEDLHE